MAAVLALAGCASVPPPAGVVDTRLTVAGADYGVEWTLPAGPPVALLSLQHGFLRQCSELRGTARQIAARGLLVMCIDADMARGNPALADALALALTTGLTDSGGRALPDRIIVGGHSAGAVFAARLGRQLDRLAPGRLRGALLFDPVAVPGFAEDLLALSAGGRRPVRAVTANASGCNAQNNALPALRALHGGFVGLQLVDRSTHIDAEGDDTSALAVLACGQPLAANVETLRTLAAQWAEDMARDVTTPAFYPGGSFVEGLRAAGRAASIDLP